MFPGSVATMVEDKPDITNYYTIAGNRMQDKKCPTICGLCLHDGGLCFILGPDDRLVPLDSVNSSPEYIQTSPPFPYNHFELLNQKDAYETVSLMRER